MPVISYNRPVDLRGDAWIAHIQSQLNAYSPNSPYTCAIARSNNDLRRETVVCTARDSTLQIRIEDDEKRILVASIRNTPQWLPTFAKLLNEYYTQHLDRIVGGKRNRRSIRRRNRKPRTRQTRRNNSRRTFYPSTNRE